MRLGRFRAYFHGLRARRRAEALCQQMYPGEPLLGSWICADEADRFVVRVFHGYRDETREDGALVMLPPWRHCLIVAVDKTTFDAAPLEDAKRYQPALR